MLARYKLVSSVHESGHAAHVLQVVLPCERHAAVRKLRTSASGVAADISSLAGESQGHRQVHSVRVGNKLQVDRTRQTMVLSFSFIELGQAALTDGVAWLPVCLRTVKIDDVEGGWSNCLRQYLRLQLLSASGLLAGGVAVNLEYGPTLIYAKVACVLADGDGHMKSWDWKGASSLKPCLRHYNVYKKVGHMSNNVPSDLSHIGQECLSSSPPAPSISNHNAFCRLE